jgi:hypothetical protein
MRTNRLFAAAAVLAVVAAPGAASAVTGVQPWAIVLCNFADTPLDPTTGARREPRTPQYFENLFTQAGAGQGGLYDYFRDESYGSLSLMGSTVAGWYTLADTRADALKKSRYDRWLNCVRQAENDLDFRPFVGAIAAFEGPYDTFGARFPATIDGITKQWGAAALDEFGGSRRSWRGRWPTGSV